MKKKLLIAFIGIITLFVLALAGYFSLPFFLKSQYFLHLVENKTHIKIEKIENYEISQTLNSIKVNISDLKLKSNRFNSDAKNISYTLNLSELFSKTPTFGNLKILNLNIKIYPSKTHTKTKTLIKPLPLSINIAKLNALYENYKINGALNVILDVATKNNTFAFNGNVNNSPIELAGDINPKNLHINLNIKKFSPIDFPMYLKVLNDASAQLKLTLKNNLELIDGKIKVSNINYKGLKLKNPSATYTHDELYLNIPNVIYKKIIFAKDANLKFNTKNYSATLFFSQISLAKLNIKKPTINFNYNKNNNNFSLKGFGDGFLVEASGTLDTKSFENTKLDGFFETPYIDYIQIKPLMSKKLQEYIFSGEIKAKKISFNGKIKDKENIFQTGELVAQNAKFIVEKGTYPFVVTFANINITPKTITINGTGFSDKVNLISSQIVIARKNGYPANMNLVLNGEFTKNTEDFLYKALLSQDDAKYIDYAKNILGPFSATIDIKDYHWHSKPHFDFNINVDSHLSLVDDKISKTPISLIGRFGIQRENQTLKVSASNLKIKNNTSFINVTGFLKHSNTIFYNVSLSGKINPNYIKHISYLKLDEKYLPTSEVTIKPSHIWGTLSRINFNADIEGKKLFKEQGYSIDEILAKGYFEKNLINLNPIKFDDAVSINGLYNIKAKVFNGEIALNNFRLSRIKNLSKLPIDEAILNGDIKLGLKDKKLQYIYSNNLLLTDLVYDHDLSVKSAHITFNKNYATITNGYAIVLGNPINFNGSLNLEPLVITLNATSQKFIVKESQNNTKSYIGNIKFKIPNAQIHANAYIGELIIQGPKPLIFNNVETHLELAKSRYLIIKAPKTQVNIKMTNNTININAADSYIFAHYIQSKTKKPSMSTLNANLQTPSTDEIDFKKLNGTLKFVSQNGDIKDFPDIYKILSLADILGLITGQIDLRKGFYFDKMVGYFELKNGILKTTTPLTVKGTSNNLFINGDVNLTNYHIDALFMITTFTFINRIISSIPIIGHILGGKEKSFTGLSFRVNGYLDGKMNIYPVPWESLSKGLFDIITRTITLPAYLLGVNGNHNQSSGEKK